MYVYMYTYMHTYMYVSVFACIHAYIHVCKCVCMHICNVAAFFRRCVQAAVRINSLLGLVTSAGRATESSWMVWAASHCDSFYKSVFPQVPQMKPAKPKYSAWCTGIDRYYDIYLSFGDRWALVGHGLYEEGSPGWVFPDLHASANAGTKLGDYMRAVLPRNRGGAFKYQHVAVTEVMPELTAAGARYSAVDRTQCAHPFDINLHGTGQEGVQSGSVFRTNYAAANKGACKTVAATLVGHVPPQWGTLRQGPFPPELSALEPMGVDMPQLNLLANAVLQIDSATHPDFHVGGRMRTLVNWVFATMIMYYPERVLRAPDGSCTMLEMALVSQRMQRMLPLKYTTGGGQSVAGSSDLTYRQWASLIREQYELDNLHARESLPAHGVDAHHTKAIERLGGSVGQLHARMTALEHENQFRNTNERSEAIALHVELDRMRLQNEKLRLENEQLRLDKQQRDLIQQDRLCVPSSGFQSQLLLPGAPQLLPPGAHNNVCVVLICLLMPACQPCNKPLTPTHALHACAAQQRPSVSASDVQAATAGALANLHQGAKAGSKRSESSIASSSSSKCARGLGAAAAGPRANTVHTILMREPMLAAPQLLWRPTGLNFATAMEQLILNHKGRIPQHLTPQEKSILCQAKNWYAAMATRVELQVVLRAEEGGADDGADDGTVKYLIKVRTCDAMDCHDVADQLLHVDAMIVKWCQL